MSAVPRIAVLGGGIAGLAAAHRLAGRAEVTLIEASERLGGKIRTEPFAGVQVDLGPDALHARAPALSELFDELGLARDLVRPSGDQAYVWREGRLRPLPPGLLAGMPGGAWPLVRARLLSPAGLARAAIEPLLPADAPAGDESVHCVVRRRYGRQVAERLAEPLIGGIYAGSAERLSVEATLPHVAAVRGRRGMRRAMVTPANGAAPGPAFVTLRHGLGSLVASLAETLDALVVTGNAAVRIVRAGGGYAVETASGPELICDGVVVAVPAFRAAPLVSSLSHAAAEELGGIEYASVAVVLMAYPSDGRVGSLEGTGFLVPPDQGRMLTACTWSSAKWPHLAGGPLAVVRCSAGRAGQPLPALSDSEFAGRAHDELAEALGLEAGPVDARVVRWQRAIPQYEVGHLRKLERIELGLWRDPAVALAGAGYRGVGVPACMAQGRAAADRVLAAALPASGRRARVA